MVSRQRKWQLANKAKGLCEKCGKERNLYAELCDDCRQKESTRENERQKRRRKERKNEIQTGS
jgi:predicted amidophosphoribosyltransferase